MSDEFSGFCMVTTTTQGDLTQKIIEAVLSRELAEPASRS